MDNGLAHALAEGGGAAAEGEAEVGPNMVVLQ